MFVRCMRGDGPLGTKVALLLVVLTISSSIVHAEPRVFPGEYVVAPTAAKRASLAASLGRVSLERLGQSGLELYREPSALALTAGAAVSERRAVAYDASTDGCKRLLRSGLF